MYTVEMTKLTDFLNKRLEELDWSMRELSRKTSLSHATISNVLSERSPVSADFCVEVARVLHERPERLLRMAGILPPTPEEARAQNPILDEIYTLVEALSPHDQETMLRILRGLAKLGPGDVIPRREDTVVTPAPEGALNERARPPTTLLSSEERFDIFDSLVSALCPPGTENREEKMRYIATVFALQAEMYKRLTAEEKRDTAEEDFPDIRTVLERLSRRSEPAR